MTSIPSRLLPGISLCAFLAVAALLLARWPLLRQWGWSALTVAILAGLMIGNLLPGLEREPWTSGIAWVRHHVLRAGIILYGFRITLHQVGQLGPAAMLVDVLMLCSTFALACWIGIRVLRLDLPTVVLIGAGSSICGAAAVMATSPCVQGRNEQIGVAVATVLLFGSLAMLLYPALTMPLQAMLALPATDTGKGWGVFIGSTVHEVGQVVATASHFGEHATDLAVLTKMFRVMLLAPFLLALGMSLRHERTADTPETASRPPLLPPFVLAFLGAIGLHSLPQWPAALIDAPLEQLDSGLLVMAMAALGLGTRWQAIRSAGLRPLLLGALLFLWLVIGGALLNRLILTRFG